MIEVATNKSITENATLIKSQVPDGVISDLSILTPMYTVFTQTITQMMECVNTSDEYRSRSQCAEVRYARGLFFLSASLMYFVLLYVVHIEDTNQDSNGI